MKHNGRYIPVSAIIPCYCCDGTIERAVQSVADQLAKPSEVFLVDDASPDSGKTLGKLHEIKNKYGHIIQIHIIVLPENGGPSVARNAAWDSATQPYIAFLDSDDAWHPQKLCKQYEWMATHVDVVMSGHRTGLRNYLEPSKDVELPPAWSTVKISKSKILSGNRFSTRSVMLKREIPFRFNEKKRYSEDYDLWLRIVFGGYEAAYLDILLGYEFKPAYMGGGLSSRLWNMERGELGCYWDLLIRRDIGCVRLLTLSIYSLMKYVRRLVISANS